MADLFRPLSRWSGQSIAVYGSPIVYRYTRHSLVAMFILWYIRNTHKTLNSASSEA